MNCLENKEEKKNNLILGLFLLISGILMVICERLLEFIPLTRKVIFVCRFKELTGIPCPSCGMTRSLNCLWHFDLINAFAMNPFIFLFLLGFVSYILYLITTGFGWFPIVKWDFLQRTSIRVSLVLFFIMNWIYLIIDKR